jgi:hypothetical protein
MDAHDVHEHTMAELTQLLLRPAASAGEALIWEQTLSALLRHVGGCNQCLAELDDTLRIVTRGADSVIPGCDSCDELLLAYAELEQEQARTRFPLVWLHLRHCEECRAAEARLRTIVVRARSGAYSPPDEPIWRQIDARVRQLTTGIAFVKGEVARITQFVRDELVLSPEQYHSSGLRFATAYVSPRSHKDASAPAGGQAARKQLSIVDIPTGEGRDIRLTVYETDDGHFDLEVRLDQNGGATVELLDAEKFSVKKAGCDQHGVAQLEGLSRSIYSLEISHNRVVQRIPLDLSHA